VGTGRKKIPVISLSLEKKVPLYRYKTEKTFPGGINIPPGGHFCNLGALALTRNENYARELYKNSQNGKFAQKLLK